MATKAIVGEKVGMTQVWDDQNRVVPVTVLRVTPCRVVQVKRPDTDGYSGSGGLLGFANIYLVAFMPDQDSRDTSLMVETGQYHPPP